MRKYFRTFVTALVVLGSQSGQLSVKASDLIDIDNVQTPNNDKQLFFSVKNDSRTAEFVNYSPDGRYIVTGSIGDDAATIWDAASGQEVRVLKGHGNMIAEGCFSPDSKYVATVGAECTWALWDVATGKILTFVRSNDESFRHVAYCPDGRSIATGDVNGTVVQWDASTGKRMQTSRNPMVSVEAIAFAPDGHRVGTANRDGTIRILDTATGACTLVIQDVNDSSDGIFFSSDGKSVLACGVLDRCPARLFDAITGDLKVDFKSKGKIDRVTSVAFSPNNRYVATGSLDGEVKLWDAKSGREIRVLGRQSGIIDSIAFSPNSQFVASTASLDEPLKVWYVEERPDIQE